MGGMYSDAGADYIFASNPTNGSVPLSYEVVLDKASDADVWLVKYNSPVDLTRSSLLADFKGYAHFKPFKEGEIYACNTAKKRIFESTSFHPEKLLRELVYIFHPELLPGYVPVYYEKMRD
jgi:iron complex transport system substrate-binding protein